MSLKFYNGKERRQFLRLDYNIPLDYKVCKKTTLSKLLAGYTSNISQAGLLCSIKQRVRKGDLIWLCFDRATLSIVSDLETRAFIYQNGIIGRAVRVVRKDSNNYEVGIQFVTREEKNLTHIYPKIHFLQEKCK